MIFGLSRASLGGSFGPLGGRRALQIRVFFWHAALLRTRFAQDLASNCKLHLILVILGLSRACLGPLWEAPLGLLAGAVPCRFALFGHQALLRTRFTQDLASNCKLYVVLVILVLSRAFLGGSFGPLGVRRALQIRAFLAPSAA